jgi:hypothetical protein
MSKATISKIGGWAFLLSGVVLFLLLSIPILDRPPFSYGVYGSQIAWVVGPVFFTIAPASLMVGLLSLHSRYGPSIGDFGRRILKIGAYGAPLITWAAWIVNAIYPGVAYLAFLGLPLGFLCLGLFGFVATRKKPLPRMNWLPLVAGLPAPIILGGYIAFISI